MATTDIPSMVASDARSSSLRPPALQPSGRRWAEQDLRSILDGTAATDRLRRGDPSGLSAPAWAAVKAADTVVQVLALLNPPELDESAEDRIGVLIGLLETLVTRVEGLERQVNRLAKVAERDSRPR